MPSSCESTTKQKQRKKKTKRRRQLDAKIKKIRKDIKDAQKILKKYMCQKKQQVTPPSPVSSVGSC